jgi:nucleotide-binding universal stress UspA family protein
MTILLALSTTRESKHGVEYALSRAAEADAELVSLFVVDRNIAASLFGQLMDAGFVGEKVGRDLEGTILEDYAARGRRRLEAIASAAGERGIRLRTELVEGSFAEETLRTMEEVGADLIILMRAERSQLSRLLFGSAVNQVRELAICPVEIVEES